VLSTTDTTSVNVDLGAQMFNGGARIGGQQIEARGRKVPVLASFRGSASARGAD